MDEQHKRDEEAAWNHIKKQKWESLDQDGVEENSRIQKSMSEDFLAGIAHCRETEVKELEEKLNAHLATDEDFRKFCRAESEILEEQIRVAVEALEFYSKRDNWKFQSFSSDTKDVIEFSDMGCKSFNGENNYADYLCSSGGRRAREALQKIEAMKGGRG